MKRWMALLLCCLLCLCAAGAMAEGAVTLSLDNQNEIDIYPNGYKLNGNFITYTGPYIITGESYGVDTCLDFYSIPHEAPLATVPVTYTVIFQKVTIKPYVWGTAVRFGHKEKNNGQDIILNLINIGDSSITELPSNHMVFENAGGEIVNDIRNPAHDVIIKIHNAPGSKLTLESGLGLAGVEREPGSSETSVFGKKTHVYEGDNVIDPKETDCTITSYHCAGKLTMVPQKPATCTEGGYQAHWKCDVCGSLFSDADGKTVTTAEALSIPAALHQLTLVPAKDPTCTEYGNKEYYRCAVDGCGKLFDDVDGTNELTAVDVSVPALGHDVTLVPAKDPTCTEDGYEAYYACANCPELFADENATMSLPQPKAIPATGHDFGEDWESDAAKHWHACQCGERSGEAEHSFVTVVDRKPGETEPGEQHEECTVCGYRKAAVSIPAVGRIDLPQTGDSSSLLRWTALLGACCAGLWCLNRRRG